MPVRRAPDAIKPDLVLLTFHDLTPLRRVEEMRADFVANASHELRTPLAALSGFIETLQGSARDDTKARERFLAIMQEQARRMARLIDDLLSLSRIELNAHRRPDTPVDLVPIVRQVVDGLQTLARDRGVTVNVEAAWRPRRCWAIVTNWFACSRTWSRMRSNTAPPASASISSSRPHGRTMASPRRKSACAITGRASRRSICRG